MPPKLKKVGKYQISSSTLGQGTFGKVKYAIDTETNLPVALKIMDKQKIKAAKIGPQIKKEIRVLKMLQHPTCIKLIEVLASPDNIFLVMELVSGGELFDRVVANGRFSENEARKYFQQLIEGLEHCHSLGVCHRDLKPENLLLDAQGNLKITDFGLASINETPSEPQILHTPCGTPNYVAPEVLMEKGYDGTLADVWSAGVILYLLVSGFLPFDEAQMVDLFRKIVVADYQYPSWLSHEVQTLIGRMIEPNVDRRATIAEIKQSAWYLGAVQSTKRKFKVPNDSGSIHTEQTTSTMDEHDEMAHILDYDDDQMIFGTNDNLLLSRQFSGRHPSSSSTTATTHSCDQHGSDHNYQFKKDIHDGREKILIGDEWKDIREWFYEKYPGKRSVIDDNVRKARRAARKAAQQQQAGNPTASTTTTINITQPISNPTAIQSTTNAAAIAHQHKMNLSLASHQPQMIDGKQVLTTIPPTPLPFGQTPSDDSASTTPTLLPSTFSPSQSFNQLSPGGVDSVAPLPEKVDEDDVIAPKQLNAFDLINMVSGQSVNNMLLFNGGDNNNDQSNSNQNSGSPTQSSFSLNSTSSGNNSNSTNGNNNSTKNNDDIALKAQQKAQHQQQSFTQFTSKCPTALLIKRLDYVLLHVPHVKYRINYKKCHINVVWTNVRNNHQVHELIEVYTLTNELHMVRCQRMTGSVIAHGEFYRIFKDNVKYLELHSTVAPPNSPPNTNHEQNQDILVATPVKKDPKSTTNQHIIITEEEIDNYLHDWSQDVLIYKDYLVKSKLFHQQNVDLSSGDIQPVGEAESPTEIATVPIINIIPPPDPNLNLTPQQIQYGLNTFRSLTLNNKSISSAAKPRTSIAVDGTTTIATEPITVTTTTTDSKPSSTHTSIRLASKPQPESSSSDDDDDSSTSEEDDA